MLQTFVQPAGQEKNEQKRQAANESQENQYQQV
jgi:hypothetical protein